MNQNIQLSSRQH